MNTNESVANARIQMQRQHLSIYIFSLACQMFLLLFFGHALSAHFVSFTSRTYHRRVRHSRTSKKRSKAGTYVKCWQRSEQHFVTRRPCGMQHALPLVLCLENINFYSYLLHSCSHFCSVFIRCCCFILFLVSPLCFLTCVSLIVVNYLCLRKIFKALRTDAKCERAGQTHYNNNN